MSISKKSVNLEVTYDADAAYIYFSEINDGEIKNTVVFDESADFVNGDVNLDFDKENRLRGIEVLDASKVLPVKLFSSIK